jgi:UPF0716 protein FxsA
MMFRSLGYFGPVFWVGAEIITYALIIQRLGIAIAILIGIVSLGVGLTVFRRLGIHVAIVATTDISGPEKMFESFRRLSWPAFGAVLLIIPGFLSNVLGFFIVTHKFRTWWSPPPHTQRQNDVSHKHQTVDLSPNEWETDDNRDDGKK